MIANYQKYWENESSGYGNFPELVYDSNYWGVWHCHDHSVLNDSTSHEFNRFPVGSPATTTGMFGNGIDLKKSGRYQISDGNGLGTGGLTQFTRELWFKTTEFPYPEGAYPRGLSAQLWSCATPDGKMFLGLRSWQLAQEEMQGHPDWYPFGLANLFYNVRDKIYNQQITISFHCFPQGSIQHIFWQRENETKRFQNNT